MHYGIEELAPEGYFKRYCNIPIVNFPRNCFSCDVNCVDRKICELEYGEKDCIQKIQSAKKQQPVYKYELEIKTKKVYNPDYSDTRICKCGKHYFKHFTNGEASCDFVECSCFKEQK